MPLGTARGAAKRGARGGGRGVTKPAANKPATTKKGNVKPQANAKKKVPQKPKWTAQQIEAATKIQKRYRLYRTRKEEELARKKKEEMDKLMEEAERDAWLKVVKMEKEKADKEHEIWLEQERERKAHLKRIKVMLESAFDGELEDMENMMGEAVKAWKSDSKEMHPARLARKILELLDCRDANGYTPLSEAAAGGAVEVINWLCKQGADPNSLGRYGRTPLYRSAFAGHVTAVQQLLECGADLRIRVEDGSTPADIATNPTIKELLQEWDVSDTDRILKNLSLEHEKRATAQAEYIQLKVEAIQDKLTIAEETFKREEKQFIHAFQELNKRIFEHDECTAEGVHIEVTLQTVHDAEDLVSELREKVEHSRKQVQMLRLQLREEQRVKTDESSEAGIRIKIKELEDVLIRDVGDKIKEDGRWPLIIDETGQASIFIRYSDTNYVNVLNPTNMEPERLRMALLGAARYGKPLVIDLMGVDIFHVVEDRFSEIKAGLLDSVLDKTFITEEKFMQIIKPSDGKDYENVKMFWGRMDSFKLWILTNADPDPKLLERFYPIRVKPTPQNS